MRPQLPTKPRLQEPPASSLSTAGCGSAAGGAWFAARCAGGTARAVVCFKRCRPTAPARGPCGKSLLAPCAAECSQSSCGAHHQPRLHQPPFGKQRGCAAAASGAPRQGPGLQRRSRRAVALRMRAAAPHQDAMLHTHRRRPCHAALPGLQTARVLCAGLPTAHGPVTGLYR